MVWDRGCDLREGREKLLEVLPFGWGVLHRGPGGRNERCHVPDHICFERLSDGREGRALEEGVSREVWVALAPGAGFL